MTKEERIKAADELAERHYGNAPGDRCKNIFKHGFIKGAEAEAESNSKELSEKTLALGNAYRLLKLLDNTIGLTEPQRKRMEQINYTITKYFDATECLRITPSAPDTTP